MPCPLMSRRRPLPSQLQRVHHEIAKENSQLCLGIEYVVLISIPHGTNQQLDIQVNGHFISVTFIVRENMWSRGRSVMKRFSNVALIMMLIYNPYFVCYKVTAVVFITTRFANMIGFATTPLCSFCGTSNLSKQFSSACSHHFVNIAHFYVVLLKVKMCLMRAFEYPTRVKHPNSRHYSNSVSKQGCRHAA